MRSRSSELEIIDGFGDSPTASNHVANGADADSDGLLEDGEFLINCNGNGSVATGSGDDFDNRSAGEKADTAVTDSVFSDVASSGSKWTDISLSTSFSNPDFPDTGGTGMPSLVISARLAPFPPNKFLSSAEPSALPLPKK